MSGMASMKALWSEVADRLRRPGPTDTLSSSPWINHPEAAQIVSTADIDDEVRRATMELITKGFTILRGVQDPTLCAAAIEDRLLGNAVSTGMSAQRLRAAPTHR